jgi:hypothetical protein
MEEPKVAPFKTHCPTTSIYLRLGSIVTLAHPLLPTTFGEGGRGKGSQVE